MMIDSSEKSYTFEFYFYLKLSKKKSFTIIIPVDIIYHSTITMI